MLKTAIIFGVTGQDGSYLSEYLLGLNYKVVGVTRRCSVDNTINIKSCLSHPSFFLLEGDVSDYLSVSGCLTSAVELTKKKLDEVYNLAAQSHVGVSFNQPINAFRINAEGPLNILHALKSIGMEDTHFYQASTSEMFGSHSGPQNERTPLAPNSPYAIAKTAAHHIVRMFREAYGMYACAGILFNHESPRRGEKFVTQKIAHYVASLYSYLQINGNNVNIEFPRLRLGNLDACRDWGYAPDYVRAMHMMLNQDCPQDYVIGTGKTNSIRDFLNEAFNCIGIFDWSDYVVVDPEFVRPLDVNYLLADATYAHNILGWTPQITFKELVTIMVSSELRKCRI